MVRPIAKSVEILSPEFYCSGFIKQGIFRLLLLFMIYNIKYEIKL